MLTIKQDNVCGHLPCEISRVSYIVLANDRTIIGMVIDRRWYCREWEDIDPSGKLTYAGKRNDT